MFDTKTSPPPRRGLDRLEERIEEGPVLGLDVDGVCCPILDGKFGREDLHPPGFVPVWSPMAGRPTIHPSLGRWLDELDHAFARCVWMSSWMDNCIHVADQAASAAASRWPWAEKILLWYSQPPVADNIPLAIVDDQFTAGDSVCRQLIARRTGPTLLICPAPEIGLGRALVDALLDFARDPYCRRFASDRPWFFYEDIEELAWTSPTDDPDGFPTEAGGLRPVVGSKKKANDRGRAKGWHRRIRLPPANV